MFTLRNFLMVGFKNAVGKLADYQIILNATGYYEKGVLLEEDLAELQAMIDAKNNPPVVEPPVEALPDEEVPADLTAESDDTTPEELPADDTAPTEETE